MNVFLVGKYFLKEWKILHTDIVLLNPFCKCDKTVRIHVDLCLDPFSI